MEALLDHGEGLLVPERMIVAPIAGRFTPVELAEHADVQAGQTIGTVEGPGTSTAIASPFAGRMVGVLVRPGERLREGQPIAWLRVH
jgi:biotin carboxyl carrier protein